MHAMILAAGRGQRMRPLTDRVPKPLLAVGGKPLIVHLINALARAGVCDLVINVAYRADDIQSGLGDGVRYGVRIVYSVEPEEALETGGGIRHALPRIGTDPFIVVNGDIWTDYPFAQLPTSIEGVSHLVLVDNPAHHPGGDFALEDRRIQNAGQRMLTFSGIGVYRSALFDGTNPGRFALAPLLRSAAANGLVSGEHYRGQWTDVGTPERLQALDRTLSGEQ